MAEAGQMMDVAIQGGVGAVLIVVFVGGIISLGKYFVFPLLDKFGTITAELGKAMDSAKSVTECAKEASVAAQEASSAAREAAEDLKRESLRLSVVCRGSGGG